MINEHSQSAGEGQVFNILIEHFLSPQFLSKIFAEEKKNNNLLQSFVCLIWGTMMRDILSVCLSIYLFMFVFLSLHLFVCSFVHMFVCFFACLFICLPVCLLARSSLFHYIKYVNAKIMLGQQKMLDPFYEVWDRFN